MLVEVAARTRPFGNDLVKVVHLIRQFDAEAGTVDGIECAETFDEALRSLGAEATQLHGKLGDGSMNVGQQGLQRLSIAKL